MADQRGRVCISRWLAALFFSLAFLFPQPAGEAQDFEAKELAVSPQTQSVIMVGSRGGTWKDDGARWQPFLDHAVSAIAYPG